MPKTHTAEIECSTERLRDFASTRSVLIPVISRRSIRSQPAVFAKPCPMALLRQIRKVGTDVATRDPSDGVLVSVDCMHACIHPSALRDADLACGTVSRQCWAVAVLRFLVSACLILFRHRNKFPLRADTNSSDASKTSTFERASECC